MLSSYMHVSSGFCPPVLMTNQKTDVSQCPHQPERMMTSSGGFRKLGLIVTQVDWPQKVSITGLGFQVAKLSSTFELVSSSKPAESLELRVLHSVYS